MEDLFPKSWASGISRTLFLIATRHVGCDVLGEAINLRSFRHNTSGIQDPNQEAKSPGIPLSSDHGELW